MKILSTILFFVFSNLICHAQIDFISSLKREQLRIDALDGKADTIYNIGLDHANKRAKHIYFDGLNELIDNLSNTYPSISLRNLEIVKLLPFFKNINAINYQRINSYERSFKIINKLYDSSSDAVILEVCKLYPTEALKLIEVFKKRNFASEFLLFIGAKLPYETLGAAYYYNRTAYLDTIIKVLTHLDPHSTKQFLSTNSPVAKSVKESKDSILIKIAEVFKIYGQSSNSFINIDALYHKRLNIAESEALIKDDTKYLNWLIDERMIPDVLGSYSIERKIGHLCHEKVDEINELHDVSNPNIRFKSVLKANKAELYTLMVYTPEEIYTSTFLGLYNRMRVQIGKQSGFDFLKEIKFNRFRTFIKQCAGFNVLEDFLKTMSPIQQDSLLLLVVKDLATTKGDIYAAVEVADIYGSIMDTVLSSKFRNKILLNYQSNINLQDIYGQFVYGLLYKLCGGKESEINAIENVTFSLPNLSILPLSTLFADGQNIQQHLFFDDEDGLASYNSFLASFKGDPNWKLIDNENYICVKSKKGLPVYIFANKPSREAQGQEELALLFAALGRYPDIAVHRGHSYYLDGTLDILNQSTKIVILGSCGGYHQVAKALENAEDVQIISTKQIGTMSVNDVLIKDMAEMLRNGKSIDWKIFWTDLEKKLKNNEKFYDYIPPYKNLGAIFIKAYKMALEKGELEVVLAN